MLSAAVLLRDRSPPQRRSKYNVHVLLGTSHTATPRKAWIFSQPQRKQSYGTQKGYQHGSPLHCFKKLGHLQSWQNFSLQNVSELKPSFQNEGSSPFNNPFSRRQLAPPSLLYSQPPLFWPLPRVFCSTDLTIPIFKEGVPEAYLSFEFNSKTLGPTNSFFTCHSHIS